MRLIPVLLAAAATAALGAISISTSAEARDGCGRGMFYNGYRCVPERYERGPDPRFYPGRQEYYGGGYRGQEYRGQEYRGGYRGGGPSERRSGGGCPKNYTVQDGQCKPYTGR